MDAQLRNTRLGLGHRAVVLGLFFASGASALMYEILWTRELSLVFGATVFAASAVLAAYMAGLALGSWALGKAADRWPQEGLKLYGALQLGIGMYALAAPRLIDALGPLCVWARAQWGMAFWGLIGVKLAAALVVLLPATALMGGTFPALARHWVRSDAGLGRGVAALYSVNTLGAVVGCAATAFVLVWRLGVQQSLWLASGASVLVGLAALALARGVTGRVRVAEPEAAPGRRLVVWLYAVCGFCALGYEALWTRMLAHVIGTDVQAFALMLTAFLVGIGVGSLVVSLVPGWQSRAVRWLAGVEALVGCGALLSVPAFAWLPQLTPTLANARLANLASCMAVMLGPALLMGAAFPLAAAAYAPSRGAVGSGVGRLYAANTLGAMLGSLVAGFVLVPVIGAQKGVCVLAGLNVAVGVLLAASTRRDEPRLRRSSVALVGAVVVACAAVAGRSLGRPLTSFRRPASEFELLYYKEGISSSVAVLRSVFDPTSKELDVNGVPVAVTHYEDFKIQKLLVHLPLLLHPRPERTLLIGFGTGCSAYGATLHSGRVTCVELEAGQRDAARLFPELNHRVLDNPRFTLHVDDGRNWLLTVPERYDVVCRDTLQPKLCQDLFSVEFYELCRRRLAPGGLMSAILPMDICPSEAYFKRLIRTFQSVFPQASLWYVGPQLALLVGGDEPLAIDWPRLVRRCRRPEVRADLAMADLADPAALASYLLMAGTALAAYAGQGEVTTDDRPLGFWETSEHLPSVEAARLTEHLLAGKESAVRYLVNVPERERPAVEAAVARAERVARIVIVARAAQAAGDWRAAERGYDQALAIDPDDANAKRGASRACNKLAEERFRSDRLLEAESLLRRSIRLDPTFVQPHLGLAACMERQGRRAEALEAYKRAAALCPELEPTR